MLVDHVVSASPHLAVISDALIHHVLVVSHDFCRDPDFGTDHCFSARFLFTMGTLIHRRVSYNMDRPWLGGRCALRLASQNRRCCLRSRWRDVHHSECLDLLVPEI